MISAIRNEMDNKGIRGGGTLDPAQFRTRIKVVGVGGSGGNAIDHMIDSGINGVDFIAVNCDVQDLHRSKAKKKIRIGKNLTKGLGAGMNPEIGRQAAEETRSEIRNALKGADLVFITCGLGGGTGTGASPVIAEAAKQKGIFTIAVVTKPFSFEGSQRARIAENGLERLVEVADTVIVVPNDRLLEISSRRTTLKNAFALCDDVLKNAVQGIAELIIKPGIINLDFADVRTIMAEAGPAIIGIGQAKGDKRAIEAARKAINSPLLDISIKGARGILFAVAGGEDLTLHEINEAAKIITESVDPEAKIIFGAFHDKAIPKGVIRITVIAAGFNPLEARARRAADAIGVLPLTGFTNPSPNIIAGSSKTAGTRHEKKQSDEGESKDDFSDMDTPGSWRQIGDVNILTLPLDDGSNVVHEPLRATFFIEDREGLKNRNPRRIIGGDFCFRFWRARSLFFWHRDLHNFYTMCFSAVIFNFVKILNFKYI